MVYRRYEDPYKLERLLYDAKKDYENALACEPENTDLLVSIAEDVAELEERLNFAWQDDEAEVEGYDY